MTGRASRVRRLPHGWVAGGAFIVFFVGLSLVSAMSPVDTSALRQPWPKQWTHTYEVHRDQVQWRHRISRTEGLFAGVTFLAPSDRQTVWDLANNYTDVGGMTPGVTAVRVLKPQPNRQVIQVDIKVLWKTLQLTFEIEQDPPHEISIRLTNQAIGEYRGVCLFDEAPTAGGAASPETRVEIATWLKPARPVPLRLLLLVERTSMLRGVRNFLETCEKHGTVGAAGQRSD